MNKNINQYTIKNIFTKTILFLKTLSFFDEKSIIKCLCLFCFVLLSACRQEPITHVTFYNNSMQNVSIKMERLDGFLWNKEFVIKPFSSDGTSYLYWYVYKFEMSLDSEKKAYCIMRMNNRCAIFVYDNGFIFSRYDEKISEFLIKKYKPQILNQKQYLIFDGLKKENITFHQFYNSPFSPIYLYDKNPLFFPGPGRKL